MQALCRQIGAMMCVAVLALPHLTPQLEGETSSLHPFYCTYHCSSEIIYYTIHVPVYPTALLVCCWLHPSVLCTP